VSKQAARERGGVEHREEVRLDGGGADAMRADEPLTGGPLAARIHLDHVVAVPHQRQPIRQRNARDAGGRAELLAHAADGGFKASLRHLAGAAELGRETPIRRCADLPRFELPGRGLDDERDCRKRRGDRDLGDDHHGPHAAEFQATAARGGLAQA
jgi:hypothetical protein